MLLWAIGIWEWTTKLLTFSTPFSCFRYKGLPFGIHSASEIFHVEIANLISEINGTASSQDDIIIWANLKKEHDRRLDQVMRNIQKAV